MVVIHKTNQCRKVETMKKIFVFLVLCGAMMNLSHLIAATETVNGITWTYTVSNGEASLGGGSSSSRAVPTSTTDAITIPSKLGGYRVTSIGDYAFYYYSWLTSVTIPDSVTSIGAYAFMNCSGMTIMTIPNSVTNIASYAFHSCSGLTSVTIPDSVTSIGSGAFAGCNNVLFDVDTIPGFILKDGWVVGYTDELPMSVDLTGVRGVADWVFNGCKIMSVNIPNSVNYIGKSAFQSCINLMSIAIPGSVKSIGDAAFSDCSGLISVRLSEGVENIGASAFRRCSMLTGMVIPQSTTDIGDSAFSSCGSLSVVVLSEGVRNLGASAFNGCALTEVTMPNSITNIGGSAFSGCSRLSSVAMGSGVERIGDYAFQGCVALSEITVPDNVFYIGRGAFSGCSSLSSVMLPFVGSNRGAGGLFGHVFYSRYGDYSSYGDYRVVPASLRSVTITDETVVGSSAFASCSMLTNITFSNTLRQISVSSFSGCSGLSEFKIPDSVETLGNNAFANCTGLKEMVVPESVELIGRGVFSGCSNLEKVTLPFVGSARENTDAADALFGHVFGTSSYAGGIATKQYYSPIEYATYYIPSSLKSVVITDETCIGYGAFYGCGGLQSVTIPECTQAIGDRAFYGCDSLLSIGFCGDASDATDLSFEGVSESCIGRVASSSSGWGETIPCVWHNLPIDYWRSRVAFDANGGSGGTDENLVVGSDVNVPTVERTGYEFAGWNPEVAATVPANDVTYIAQWTPKTYAVSFDSDGGSPAEIPSIVVTYDSPYGELPTVAREGYAFLGWEFGSDVIESDTVVSATCDHQLVAKWQKMSYTVRYDANGGIGEMEDDSFVLGVSSALSANVFHRTGYAFIGWAVVAEGTVAYADSETVLDLCDSPGGMITLFAVWVKDGSNVTFEFGGDVAWYSSQNIREGEIAWQSGTIGDNQMSVIKTTVVGEGTISFDWQCSCEGFFRNIRLDYLGFCIDGEEKTFINGSTDWTNVSFAVEGEGPHELLWRYVKDSAGSEYDDCGRLSSVVWEPDIKTIDAYLNASNLTFSTSETAGWFGQTILSHPKFRSVIVSGASIKINKYIPVL